MKKANRKIKDDLRPEYHFANRKVGVRGKYAAQTRSRTNLMLLDPEIAKAFPAGASVNQVLRWSSISRHGPKAPPRARSPGREKT